MTYILCTNRKRNITFAIFKAKNIAVLAKASAINILQLQISLYTGTTALLSILSGAKRTYTKLPHTTRYVKNGNLNSATEEFSSLTQATEIKEFPLKKVNY